MTTYKKNEQIEVFVPEKGWFPGRYIFMVDDDDNSEQLHVIECPDLWYGAIKTPDDKIRKIGSE